MITTVKMQARGVLTLPKKIRDAVGIGDNAVMDIETKDGAVVMRPHTKLSAELLDDVRSAMKDWNNGDVSPSFSSGSELEAYMKSRRTTK